MSRSVVEERAKQGDDSGSSANIKEKGKGVIEFERMILIIMFDY